MNPLRKKGMIIISMQMMTMNRQLQMMTMNRQLQMMTMNRQLQMMTMNRYHESAPPIFSMKNKKKKECPFSSMRDCCIYSASRLSY
jgi:hypothetical protein